MAIQYAQENPFRDCADPGSAIPSSACDRALAALEQAIVARRSPIVLLGPIGAGKTLLLHRIVDRPPPSIRTIFLPWLNVPPEEVIPWIRAFESSEAPAADFVAVARAFHAQGVRTLLMVDEAQSMPRGSAVRLAELVSAAGSAVQVLLAGMEGASMQAAVEVFHGDAEHVELEGEVTPPEVATWAHNTLNADELSRLRELDWAELVHKVQGIPRLVRWELERRLAMGDGAASLGQRTLEVYEGTVDPVQTAKPVALLPTARNSPQATVPARSIVEMPIAKASGEIRPLLTGGLRHIAVQGGAARREGVHPGLRYALLLGRAFAQAADQFRDAATSCITGAAARVADPATGASARGRAALHNARTWEGRYSTGIVQAARVAFTRALRRGAAMLKRVVLRPRHTAETITLAETGFTTPDVLEIREAAGREQEHRLELVRVRRRTLLSDPSRPNRPWPLSDLRAGSLMVVALVVGAFVLGRISVPPSVGSRAHEFPPQAPAIVSSGPPLERGKDQTIAPQPREGSNSAHEPPPAPPVQSTKIASEERAETTTPAPPAKPSRPHKRRLIKQAVRPSPPAPPATEAPPVAPEEGNQAGWVIRRR
jgi:hypothetical protein